MQSLSLTGLAYIKFPSCFLRSRRNYVEESHSIEKIEVQGLTYGEVDLLSFVAILKAAGARDNHVFADLVNRSTLHSITFSGLWSWENYCRCRLVWHQIYEMHWFESWIYCHLI